MTEEPTPEERTPEERWRIDDLAHETGLTVDTIRYYQRECLLPPGEREGRHRIYGPDHVRRIKRIKELQARRFSIAAIRALVAMGGNRLDSIFADEGEDLRLTLEELLDRSGASAELAAQLHDAGVLRDPHEFGRVAYDGDDLEMMSAMAELERIGLPTRGLRVLGQVYAEGLEATQRRVVDVFRDGGDFEWQGDELSDFQEAAATIARTLHPAMRRLVEYTHHRTMQRLALDAVLQEVSSIGVDPDATDELVVTPPEG